MRRRTVLASRRSRTSSSKVRLGTYAAAAALVAASGLALSSVVRSNPAPGGHALHGGVQPRQSSYPVNREGETYGSGSGAATPSGEPDLIAAIATNGRHGYVSRARDQAAGGGDVTSPSQAVAWDNQGSSTSPSIPVYTANGRTVIGVFAIDPSLLAAPSVIASIRSSH